MKDRIPERRECGQLQDEGNERKNERTNEWGEEGRSGGGVFMEWRRTTAFMSSPSRGDCLRLGVGRKVGEEFEDEQKRR